MLREADVLTDAFWDETHPEVERSVAAEAERLPSVVRMHLLGTQETLELHKESTDDTETHENANHAFNI